MIFSNIFEETDKNITSIMTNYNYDRDKDCHNYRKQAINICNLRKAAALQQTHSAIDLDEEDFSTVARQEPSEHFIELIIKEIKLVKLDKML